MTQFHRDTCSVSDWLLRDFKFLRASINQSETTRISVHLCHYLVFSHDSCGSRIKYKHFCRLTLHCKNWHPSKQFSTECFFFLLCSFNQLSLPSYSSFKEMQKKLLLAINEGSEGFGFAWRLDILRRDQWVCTPEEIAFFEDFATTIKRTLWVGRCCSSLALEFHECSTWSFFSLHYPFIVKETCDQKTENYQLVDVFLIFRQILTAYSRHMLDNFKGELTFRFGNW